MSKDYSRDIKALDDEQLEKFVRKWALKKDIYFRVQQLTGTGDRGRDVVGFYTNDLHEGPWDNFQCKQYGITLPTATGILEVGKILYFSSLGEFTAPRNFYFVAPRGVNRNLKSLILNPSTFKAKLIDEWDEYCRDKIVENEQISLTPALKSFIQGYDFSGIQSLSVAEILDDPASKPVLYEIFGADPGEAPDGVVPDDVQDSEQEYISQLLAAYSETDSTSYLNVADIGKHPSHWNDLCVQRERFFDADAFLRFYRDNVYANEIGKFKREVRSGIYDIHSAEYELTLRRIKAVLSQAAVIQPSGVLAKHAGVTVKQGVCHQFINDKEMTWKI